MSSEGRNLERIAAAIKLHDANCSSKAKAVLLNPFEFKRLGWDEIMGIPVKSDDSLGTGRFRILCDGYHGPKREKEESKVVAPPLRERELVDA